MTEAEIRKLITHRLPSHCEHLKLTFYGRTSRLNGDYIIFGDDYGTDLCVRLDNGAVYSIDPEGRLPMRFVNSGIDELAKFIETVESFSGSTLDRSALSEQIGKELEVIDSMALATRENWWAVVLEQLAVGL